MNLSKKWVLRVVQDLVSPEIMMIHWRWNQSKCKGWHTTHANYHSSQRLLVSSERLCRFWLRSWKYVVGARNCNVPSKAAAKRIIPSVTWFVLDSRSNKIKQIHTYGVPFKFATSALNKRILYDDEWCVFNQHLFVIYSESEILWGGGGWKMTKSILLFNFKWKLLNFNGNHHIFSDQTFALWMKDHGFVENGKKMWIV